jgi:hypothetical protein
MTRDLSSITEGAQPTLDIVAVEDGTTVTISATSAIVGGDGVAPAAKGTPATYSLGKGQILKFSQGEELPQGRLRGVPLGGGAAVTRTGARCA